MLRDVVSFPFLGNPSDSMSRVRGELENDVGVDANALAERVDGVALDSIVFVVQCMDESGNDFCFSAFSECFQGTCTEPRVFMVRCSEQRLESFRVLDFRERFQDVFLNDIPVFVVEECLAECVYSARVISCSECMHGVHSNRRHISVIVY